MLLAVLGALALAILYRRHVQHQMNEEKLRFLISAIHNDDQPLSLEEMRKAINGFVQSRKKQRDLYGNTAVMADRMETPEVKGNDEVLMDRIIQSVNKHLSDSEYSIEQLCSEAGISRAQLHRKMKELTGVSTSEFIRGIRLEQAARLLHEQKLNITQVAYTVGFSTAAHFSTVFKKHFGVSPSDYIEQKKRE
jgi:AraC-like DNA-binding protein